MTTQEIEKLKQHPEAYTAWLSSPEGQFHQLRQAVNKIGDKILSVVGKLAHRSISAFEKLRSVIRGL